MGFNAYLTVTTKGKKLEGDCEVEGRKGTIECLSFDYGAAIPLEGFDGTRLNGNRKHRAIKILKRIDKSTPLLFKAVCDNEMFTNGTFEFYGPTPAGKQVQWYKVTIENGYVASVKEIVKGGDTNSPMFEEVTFVFEKITHSHVVGKTEHTDTWKKLTAK